MSASEANDHQRVERSLAQGKYQMRMNDLYEEATPEDWAKLESHYSPEQIALLKFMARMQKKVRWFNVYHLIPQWFEGAAPLRGSARLKAPHLDSESRAKFDALWRFGKEQNSLASRTAAVHACLYLWEALFPEDYERAIGKHYGPMKSVHDFDPLTNDMEAVVQPWTKNDSPAYAAAFDMRCMGCVRIPEEFGG